MTTGLAHQKAIPPPPPVLAGFEKVNRYWDKSQSVHAAKILPGELYVSVHGEMVVTVLGSCVAACIRDRVKGIGGMNHFLLAKPKLAGKLDSESSRYGSFAMEQLINSILKQGGSKNNLEIKLFGGSEMIKSSIAVGDNNINFVHEYLRREAFSILAEDLGGKSARRIHYWPSTGKVMRHIIKGNENKEVLDQEKQYENKIIQEKANSGAVELF